MTIGNSTFSGNSVDGTHAGGALSTTGTVKINNSTFSGNSAGTGGALNVGAGTLTVKNTIIADNAGGNCAGVPPTSSGSNIDSGTSCALTAGGDQSDTDPLLGPLQDNGGPTQTLALQTGSPAIDAGGCTDIDGADVREDQRGSQRPAGSGCDIGAFESSVCGDGSVGADEGCDDGAANNDTEADACRTTCVPAGCGDGVIDTGESCDDGNTTVGDGCDDACATESSTAATTGSSGGGCSLVPHAVPPVFLQKIFAWF